MNEIFKSVPSIEGLEINHDGSIVKYYGSYRHISTQKNRGIPYKIIYLNKRRISISRLVYEAFIGPYPESRNILYIDGNTLNTNYKNLWPKYGIDESIRVKKVIGFDELYVNNNGTYLCQNNYEVSIQILGKHKKAYPYASIKTFKGSKMIYVSHLVAYAYLDWNGKGKIMHLDKDVKNNSYLNLKIVTDKEYRKIVAKRFKEIRYLNPIVNSKIPDKDADKVIERIMKGEPLKAIAKDYNCSDMSVVRFKKRYLTPEMMSHIKTLKSHKAKKEEVIKSIRKGENPSYIAAKFDMSVDTVYRWKRNM